MTETRWSKENGSSRYDNMVADLKKAMVATHFEKRFNDFEQDISPIFMIEIHAYGARKYIFASAIEDSVENRKDFLDSYEENKDKHQFSGELIEHIVEDAKGVVKRGDNQ